jgi:hypothetical protein
MEAISFGFPEAPFIGFHLDQADRFRMALEEFAGFDKGLISVLGLGSPKIGGQLDEIPPLIGRESREAILNDLRGTDRREGTTPSLARGCRHCQGGSQ